MKTKNAFLAAFAFCVAVGGAFASMLANETVYLHARLNSANGAIVCVATDAQCDNTGSQICQVTVDVIKPGVGSQTATTTGTFKTWRVTCQSTLANTSFSPVVAEPILEEDDQIYELID
jgi:hypothetical protein